MALRDAVAKTPQAPPNLRRGDARQNCANCVHGIFEQGSRNGECGLYGARVKASEVCDSYKAAGGKGLAGALNGGGR